MNKFFFLNALLAVFSGITIATAQSQWRGPNRDGIYPAMNLLKQWPADGPKMLWSFEGIGQVFSLVHDLCRLLLTIWYMWKAEMEASIA